MLNFTLNNFINLFIFKFKISNFKIHKYLQMKLYFTILLIITAFVLTASCKNNRVNQFAHLNESQKSEKNTSANKVAAEEQTTVIDDTVATFKNNSAAPEDPKVSGEFVNIVRVIDGDTFVIFNIYGSEEKIRLIGVNAPESRNSGKKKKEEFGEESKKYLTNLLKNAKVRLEFDVQRVDRYGRTLAYVYLENGTFLNEYLVKNGYAQVATFPPNVKYKDLFIDAQRYARENKTGLWK